jgi:hypothetical protein
MSEPRLVRKLHLSDGTGTAGTKSHAELLILCARNGFNP